MDEASYYVRVCVCVVVGRFSDITAVDFVDVQVR